jgi:glutathione S-transferase
MKLYYAPGACSQATRIILNELGVDADYVRVDVRERRTEDGGDYLKINPLGYVPALELDDGTVIIENAAILPLVADKKPGTLVPEGGFERVRFNEWLSFLSAELHKSFGPLFFGVEGEAREKALQRLRARIGHVERQLSDGREWLLGEPFTVVDAYAFVILSWAKGFDISLAEWPNVSALVERVESRPAVQRALQEEGLLEAA